MATVDERRGIEPLDQQTCLRLLASKEVGRLAFLSAGRPQILPVNYVLDGDAVVFASGSGAKLWGATRSEVAFEVDDTEPLTRSGWSVIVHGLPQEVTDLDHAGLLERVRALPLRPWPAGYRPNLVRIAPWVVTGRRIRPALQN
jgi:nitroimidazol reductase NimA-like FMN-containing flavoprotein (pyridoxamine 5'-phosphate oxidase superfamily)